MCSEDDFLDDPLFEETVNWVVLSGKVSVSAVQRKFRLGYNRAARLVEGMEVVGIVSTLFRDNETSEVTRKVLCQTISNAHLLIGNYELSRNVEPTLSNVIQFPTNLSKNISSSNISYRDLLKKATELKREKQYNEACVTLYAAFSSVKSGEYVDIKERLRLPIYLNFADRKKESWHELLLLKDERKDFFDQFAINWTIFCFLRDDGDYNEACKVLVAHHFRYLAHLRDSISEIEKSSDRGANSNGNSENYRLACTGTTPVGNPVYDVSYPHQLKSYNRDMLLNSIQNVFTEICDLKKVEPSSKKISMRLKREVIRGSALIKADDIAERILSIQ